MERPVSLERALLSAILVRAVRARANARPHEGGDGGGAPAVAGRNAAHWARQLRAVDSIGKR